MSLPFYIVNAFTTRPYGGNPAAIVFVDELENAELMHNIAKNLNQPMTAFLRAVPVEDAATATFDVRWFNAGSEHPICGHATIASSGLMFSTPGLISPSVEVITYRAKSGLVLTARKAGDWIDLTLPASQIQPLSGEETERWSLMIRKAAGKEVSLKFAGAGVGGFSHFLLTEIDAGEDLAAWKIDPSALGDEEYHSIILTSASSDSSLGFVSRVFFPKSGMQEDPVCGAAHCLLGPYWAQRLAKLDAEEILAKQVSTRGGDLKVRWHEAKGEITLSGQSRSIVKGEVLL